MKKNPSPRRVISGLAACLLLFCFFTTSTPALGKERQNNVALSYFKKLKQESQETQYRAMEDWVFAPNLSIAMQRERLTEAIAVLADRMENAVWADSVLAKIEKESGSYWWAWQIAGDAYSRLDGMAVMENGKPVRTAQWSSNVIYLRAQDQARARQCYLKAMQMALAAHVSGDELARLYLDFAHSLENDSVAELYHLSDVSKIPEITGESRSRDQSSEESLIKGHSPAVGEDDQWSLPQLRPKFEGATSDLERIYWLLNEAAKISQKYRPEAQCKLALQWYDLLGVRQLALEKYIYIEGKKSESEPAAAGEFELSTLKDNETIILGVNGPSRRTLPEEYSYLNIWKNLLNDPLADESIFDWATENLMESLADRQQFDEMESLATQLLKRAKLRKDTRSTLAWYLKQIGPDAEFSAVDPFVTGQEVKVEFVSREISQQHFELWHLDTEKLLADRGGEHWDEIRQRIFREDSLKVDQKEAKNEETLLAPYYKIVAQWEVAIPLKANHRQTLSQITVPVKGAGMYMIVARLPDEQLVQPLRVAQTIIANVDTEEGDLDYIGDFFVIDAVTGKPVLGAEVSSIDAQEPSVSDHQGFLTTQESDGILVVRRQGFPAELLEVPGISGMYPLASEDITSFLITNQPLYRPMQKVEFAGWLKRPNWRNLSSGRLPKRAEIRVKVTDPVGQIIYEKETLLDEFGGFTGDFQLGSEIVLGKYEFNFHYTEPSMWHIDDPFGSNQNFKKKWVTLYGQQWTIDVGEFRKPDFQVKLTTETNDHEFVAEARANYLSGEPVVGAKVKAELQAYLYQENIFPKRKWDDLYDAGYAWELPRPKWLKGSKTWAIVPYDEEDDDFPGTDPDPVYVVGVTDENGIARLKIPNKFPTIQSFIYDCTIRVGVQEFTGRSVVKEESFTHTGRAFELFAKPIKPFYHAGEEVRVNLRTMDSKSNLIAGHGEFRVESIHWDGKNITMKPVWKTQVDLGKNGKKQIAFTPPAAGQYRCIFANGKTKRGFVLEVLGERESLGRYDGIQIISDKSVCQPGDTVNVLIQTQVPNAKVWIFEIMPDGHRRTPRLIETHKQTAWLNIPISQHGKPEFYVQAMTVVEGRLKSCQCRIVVPPIESQLHLKMTATPEKARPGDRAKVAVRVTDFTGKPAEASLAITAFDQALEDLSHPLANAGSRMRERFEIDSRPQSSQDPSERHQHPFTRLAQLGCFNETGDIVGDLRQDELARFEKLGTNLWVSNEPPELPNSVGMLPDGGSIFPMTPATPTIYSTGSRPQGIISKSNPRDRSNLKKVSLRKNFADRAYWGAPLFTDKNGRISIDFKLPDNLTAWRVQSWAFGKDQTFGDAQLSLPVSKPLQIRPLIPRAAVVGDRLVIGALVQNLSKSAHQFSISLEADGVAMGDHSPRSVEITAGKEGIAEWKVVLEKPGSTQFRFRVSSADGTLSDGTEATIPVAAFQVPVTVVSQATIAAGQKSTTTAVAVDQSIASAVLRVRVETEPALGALMVLPDLIQYPYGCTEQTLNRFLPALIAWKAADKLGLDWKSMQNSVADASHPLIWVNGRGRPLILEKPTKLSEKKVRAIIYTGLDRLGDLQNKDGWWGWFSPEDYEEQFYLTALAVRGLARARDAGFVLPDDPGKSGASWLETWAERRAPLIVKNPEKVSAQDAFVVYALSESTEKGAPELKKALLGMTDTLPDSAIIHLALSLDLKSEKPEMQKLLALAEKRMSGIEADKKYARYWWEDHTELNAWFLKLLVKSQADKAVVRKQITQLLALRSDGIHWKSTRDSALALEAIIDAASYCGGFKKMGAKKTQLTVLAAGVRRELTLEKKNLWSSQITVPVDKATIKKGQVPVTVHQQGKDPVFVTATATYQSSAAQHMKAQSEGVKVNRQYFLSDEKGKRTLLKEGDTVKSGSLIEVVITLTSKVELGFLHLRDPIPAGLEPLIQTSGYEQGAYRESRTGEAHFFLTRLTPWNNQHRYWLRAVTAGTSSALPPHAECMYAPDIHGQGGMQTIKVE